VSSSEAVDEAMANAAAAGGEVVKQAAASQWGGYFGYFSDPDGYLWKGRLPLLGGSAHRAPNSSDGPAHRKAGPSRNPGYSAWIGTV
jgi:hypothetical protein